MENSKLISVVEEIIKYGEPCRGKKPIKVEWYCAISQLLHILRTLNSVEIRALKCDEKFSPHYKNGFYNALEKCRYLLAKYKLRAEKLVKELEKKVIEEEDCAVNCQEIAQLKKENKALRAGGSERENAIVEGKNTRIRELQDALADIRGRAGVEKINKILKFTEVTFYPRRKTKEATYYTLDDKSAIDLAQAISKEILNETK